MELLFLALLFLLMMYGLGSGYPVAFALPGAAIITILLAGITGYLFVGDAGAYFIQDGPIEWLTAGVTNFRGLYWEVERDTLIAIPLFIFMGIMLQRSRVAEDLLITMAQLFGSVPGGLGISVVFVGALLAATTGIVGATVVAMGLISLPAMLQNNYSKSLATGTICASGTLGQIIPPSIVLIILADQLASAADQAASQRKALYKAATGEFSMPSHLDIVSTSAGDMFLGAFIPGIVLVLLYIGYILITALVRPKFAPAIPYEGKLLERGFMLKVLSALIPPLVLIFAVLGSIIAGVATVNQAGAIGAAGATIMAGYRLCEGEKGAYYPAILAVISLVVLFALLNLTSFNIQQITSAGDGVAVAIALLAIGGFLAAIIWSGWRAFKIGDTLNGVMIESAKTTSMVFIILLGAAMLTAAFRAFGGEEIVRHFLTSLPGGFWTQFIVVMLVIFILGFFLDFIEIAVVVVPIVAPILLADPTANVTAVWLGVMLGMNIQTSFLTPPFGFALFYLRGVASKAVKTIDIYKGVIPFIALQLLGLAVVGFYPPLVNYLPVHTYLTSEHAPPPKNPRLKACLDDHLFDYYVNNKEELANAGATLLAQDLSPLSDKIRVRVEASAGIIDPLLEVVDDIREAEALLSSAEGDYRIIHTQVRDIERDIRRNERSLERLKKTRRGATDASRANSLDSKIRGLEAENAALKRQIPSQWESSQKDYKVLSDNLLAANLRYNRLVNEGYASITEAIRIIESSVDLDNALPDLNRLKTTITADGDFELMREQLKTVSSVIAEIPGTSEAGELLAKAKKDLRKGRENALLARESIGAATVLLEEDLRSRNLSQESLLPALNTYELAIRHNIGLRQQSQLPDAEATAISGCLAQHRDISLYF